MFPLRCLSFLLLSALFIYCNAEATETLIEMKGDKLSDGETEQIERVEGNNTTNFSTEAYDNELRVLNKDFDRLGKIYVAQYYMLFDDPTRRLSLVSLYHHEDSFLSFEGKQFHGTKEILKKFDSLKLGKITRSICSVDSQPLPNGGVIINVIGKTESKEHKSLRYAQTFIFMPQKGSFFLQHDIFRLICD
ncbi:CLUMA_CG009132, isoform A [Clunio marinus]|uniref:CLUMA_CG009132, isoform A n=1 Tax=Clunio marinus TaxID=568069 RepID=A0A1J1I7F4_9DIPT|nr:CLUMA_CG009132, isoform A [Clunio marinus]